MRTTDELIDNVTRLREEWSVASLTGKPDRFALYEKLRRAEDALAARETILSIASMFASPRDEFEEPYRGPIEDAEGHDVS